MTHALKNAYDAVSSGPSGTGGRRAWFDIVLITQVEGILLGLLVLIGLLVITT